MAQREEHWLLQAYKDPERLVQVQVGEVFSCVSNHHAVWIGLVNTVKLGEKSCRGVNTRFSTFWGGVIRRMSLVIFCQHERTKNQQVLPVQPKYSLYCLFLCVIDLHCCPKLLITHQCQRKYSLVQQICTCTTYLITKTPPALTVWEHYHHTPAGEAVKPSP